MITYRRIVHGEHLAPPSGAFACRVSFKREAGWSFFAAGLTLHFSRCIDSEAIFISFAKKSPLDSASFFLSNIT